MQVQLRRRAIVVVAAALPLWAQGADDTVVAFAGSSVRFASVEAARSSLAADDEWLRAAGPFNLRAIMGRTDAVSKADFRRWVGSTALPWPAEQQQRWTRALEALAPGWNALRIPLPPEVLLVGTTGQEQAGQPHTRGQAIMVPVGLKAGAAADDVWLMAHELWHVASRLAPDLASRLYAEIGFEPMPPLAFPETWAPIRLANPDAPEHRHAMRLSVGDREVRVTPVLVAARTELKPGETFFNVLDVRLLEVQADGNVSRAVLRDGQPVWHPVQASHDYLKRLGGNTGYVIHPEETMADNVALLATGRPARNTELLARIKAALSAR
jgi:hypothetical protein